MPSQAGGPFKPGHAADGRCPSVGTGALLALFAVVTAWYTRKAFREQAQELGVL